MTLHRNARTRPESRELIARRVLMEGWTQAAASEAAGVSVPTARKRVRRRARGESLEDRSSSPRRVHNRTPDDRVEAVLALRRIRLTAEQIAAELEMAPSTVSLICKREGLWRLPPLEPTAPVRRYERKRAGELIHVDVKKLGRTARPGPPSHRPGYHRQASHEATGLGLRPRDGRRRDPDRLRRGPGRRAPRDRDRLPAPRVADYRLARDQGERLMTDG